MREKWKMSPNYTNRPRGLDDVWGVVIHHTATAGDSGAAVAEFFSRPSAEVSAHVVIDKRGDVWHCVSIDKAAWHAGRCRRYDWDKDGINEDWEQYANRHTIGIEFCHPGSLGIEYPDEQIRSAAKLIRRWNRKCPNLDYRNITDHQAINLNGKIDVRKNFPAAKLFWYIIHPYTPLPNNPYDKLPKWARRQVDEIKR